MDTFFLEPGGIVVPVTSLSIARARDVAIAISSGALEHVRLVECRSRKNDADTNEIIILDLDIERSQVTNHDIRHVERVATVFRASDKTYPEVLSLRSDFPLVPHLNLGYEEFPRSLCLYDQSWDELCSRWTAPSFIERIRKWLADTASGTLHREDQPLEPLIFGSSYRLILPADFLTEDKKQAVDRLHVRLLEAGPARGTFFAFKQDLDPKKPEKTKFIAALFRTAARKHGIIRHAPRNIEDLGALMEAGGTDLLSDLRNRVKLWKDQDCLNAELIMVISFPLSRENGRETEIVDLWAFLTDTTVRELGMNLGVWGNFNGEIGLLLSPDESMRGKNVRLDVLRPQFAFSRESASTASGVEPDACKIVAVGVGALGSQVVLNLVRSGFGTWALVDEDELLPHNLGRHGLPPWFQGAMKAEGMASLIDHYYKEDTPTRAISANILHPGEHAEAVTSALAEAEIILDIAASVPVARHLTHGITSEAKRVSLFLNPRGTDLVCLAEGKKRELPLDCIELQYYRAVLREVALKGHLAPNESRLRYARSCRDVSFTLPSNLVSLHGAIGSQAVRTARQNDGATARVWHSDPVTCAVSLIDIKLYPILRAIIGGWTLIVDAWLIAHLAELRISRLPNETGGVFIGAYDLPRKTVYLVDTIPSPSDSIEWPTLYIRGSEGLLDRVREISELTAGQLEYIGEWHSHPDQCRCTPSADDMKVFAWMMDRMSAAGLPALMAIIGQNATSAWFLERMEDDHRWDTNLSDFT